MVVVAVVVVNNLTVALSPNVNQAYSSTKGTMELKSWLNQGVKPFCPSRAVFLLLQAAELCTLNKLGNCGRGYIRTHGFTRCVPVLAEQGRIGDTVDGYGSGMKRMGTGLPGCTRV